MNVAASNIAVIVSLVAAIVSVVVAVALVFIYRNDVQKSATRRDDQNAQWGIELAKVSGVLVTTQELLTAQQDSNKIILNTNEKLTSQVAEVQRELKEVRKELAVVRKQLEAMTARAEAAEDRVGEDE